MAHPEETELAKLLHRVYRKWAGNMGCGDHLPETWNAVAEKAMENRWTCFHCGETFTTKGSAEDHFGKTPESKPGCLIKVQLGDERGLEMELRKFEAEAAEWRARALKAEDECEALASQVGSWEIVSGCRSSHDLYMRLDSIQGKILVASLKLDAALENREFVA